jgi:hypothetical protein
VLQRFVGRALVRYWLYGLILGLKMLTLLYNFVFLFFAVYWA